MQLPLLISLLKFFRTNTSELVSFRKPDAFLALVEPNKTPARDVDLNNGHLWLNNLSGQLHFRHLRSWGCWGSVGRRANAALIAGSV